MQKRYPRWGWAVIAGLIVLVAMMAGAAPADSSSANGSELSVAQAIVLGIVEGLTEYRP